MADEKEEFFSFDEALDQLRLKEEELKRLVSEGEIRAFRDGETMKLRVTDVEGLRGELSGGEVVDLGDAGEELVFEDEDDVLGDAGMATEEISEMDTLLDEDVEDVGELELELEELDDLDSDLDDLDEDPDGVPRPRAAAVVEESFEGAGIQALVILTSLVLFLGIPIIMATKSEGVGRLAKGVASLFGADFEN